MAGSLRQEPPAEPAEAGGAWNWVQSRLLRPLWALLLERPPEDFDDAIPEDLLSGGKEVDAALSGVPASRWRPTPDGRAVVLGAAHPIWSGTEVIGAVVAEETTNSVLTLRNRVFEQLLTVTLAVFVLGAGTLLVFASRLSGRLRRLRDEAEQAIDVRGRVQRGFRASGDSDEIGDLSPQLRDCRRPARRVQRVPGADGRPALAPGLAHADRGGQLLARQPPHARRSAGRPGLHRPCRRGRAPPERRPHPHERGDAPRADAARRPSASASTSGESCPAASPAYTARLPAGASSSRCRSGGSRSTARRTSSRNSSTSWSTTRATSRRRASRSGSRSTPTARRAAGGVERRPAAPRGDGRPAVRVHGVGPRASRETDAPAKPRGEPHLGLGLFIVRLIAETTARMPAHADPRGRQRRDGRGELPDGRTRAGQSARGLTRSGCALSAQQALVVEIPGVERREPSGALLRAFARDRGERSALSGVEDVDLPQELLVHGDALLPRARPVARDRAATRRAPGSRRRPARAPRSRATRAAPPG